eukprot:TRINITY_DN7126_c0_g1_i1.p2 TRINITY_DN7126_c0_g1~~TRINITY_DN7126_c0_g1_i1.p2  ORF type:complete len:159 (+),score=21.62 TRINITY_DN7126_c0_g1_i1:517-993(+)
MRSWMGGRMRLLAAEKTDRASVQKRFFSQQRLHHDAVPGAAAGYGAPAPSGGAPGRGSTAGAGGRSEARSSRKDVLASLDLLALSQDGSKRGHPARRVTPLRAAGGSVAAPPSRPPPANYHRSNAPPDWPTPRARGASLRSSRCQPDRRAETAKAHRG